MTYTLEMRDDGGSSETTTIEADDLDDGRETAEDEVRDWVRDGEYGAGGASVSAYYTLTDEGGDVVVDDLGITVDFDPDDDTLIRAAGGDPDCDHDWNSDGEGGVEENPGVWSLGGTAMTIAAHCRTCGLRRCNRFTGAQRNPGEHDTVTYTQPDSWCSECERVECECEDARGDA